MGRGKPQVALKQLPAEPEPFTVLQCQGEHTVIQQINALEKRLFSKAFALTGEIHQELTRRNTVLLYACARQGSEDIVLGYVVYQTNSVVCHVQKLAVHPSSRNQGIASTLLLAALQKAVSERRVQEATLNVSIGNAPAIRVYRRLGFVDRAQVEDYYGPGRPALRMTSDLAPESNPAWAAAIAAAASSQAA